MFFIDMMLQKGSCGISLVTRFTFMVSNIFMNYFLVSFKLCSFNNFITNVTFYTSAPVDILYMLISADEGFEILITKLAFEVLVQLIMSPSFMVSQIFYLNVKKICDIENSQKKFVKLKII